MSGGMIKTTIREIRGSLGRYMAILAIVMLGVGFFAGLKATTPAMIATENDYLAEQDFFDLRLLSTVGFEQEAVGELAGLEEIEYAEGAVSVDALCSVREGSESVYRFHSVPETINRLVVTAGRMPESGDECLLDGALYGEESIGLQVRVTDSNDEDTLEMFRDRSFTAVGIARSPYYINFERGTASIGDGKVAAFVYVPEEAFDCDYLTEIYVTGTEKYDVYTDEYKDYIERLESSVEDKTQELTEGRYEELIAEAGNKIDDAQRELDEKKAEAEEELGDAWEKILDGEKEIADGEQELLEGEQKLSDGRREIADHEKELLDGEQEIADGEREIQDKEQELAEAEDEVRYHEWEIFANEQELAYARAELEEGKEELRAQEELLYGKEEELLSKEAELKQMESDLLGQQQSLEETAAELEGKKQELEGLLYALESGSLTWEMAAAMGLIPEEIDSAEAFEYAKPALKEELRSGIDEIDAYSGEIQSGRDQLQSGLAQLRDGFDQINGGKYQLEEGKEKLREARAEIERNEFLLSQAEDQLAEAKVQVQDARAELEEGKVKLADAKAELEDGRAELEDGRAELARARTDLADAQKELEDGRAELEDGRIELADARTEYGDAQRDFRREVADAQAKIDDAREELADIGEPDEYVLNRNTNIGYACYESDSNIVAAIANVFPLFFFLVAALICMTTMNRMVEEQRTQIGVLKALGYGNASIMGKYLFYAGSAAAVGALIGCIGGTWLFPRVIWMGYGIMYNMGEIQYYFDIPVALLSLAAALLCSMGAAYFSCRHELQSVPANLIRPRAPKSGKRIFLEKVTFIWSRLKFLHKVSVRNIIRYKKRFFMMILGISGCTALLVTGFGIKDSVTNIAEMQYDEIQVYDIGITFSEGVQKKDLEELTAQTDGVIGQAACRYEESVEMDFGGRTKSVYLEIPENEEEITAFLKLPPSKGRGASSKSNTSGGEYSAGGEIPYPAAGEAVLTAKIAENMGIRVGDQVVLRDNDMNSLTVTVTALCENYVYNYIYINKETYREQLGTEPEYRSAYVTTAEGADVHEAAALISDSGNVMAVSVIQDMRERIANMMKSMDYIVLLIIVCAGSLAFIVLYNLTNINITERIREIATIKVLGFYARETADYVFRENLVLTGMGAAAGLGLGKWLHWFVMYNINIDMVSFKTVITPASYLWSFLLTFCFAMLVNSLMYFKLEKINMAESLKSIE